MTTLNPSSPKPPTQGQGSASGAQAAEITTQARDAFRVAVIMLGVVIVSSPVYLYLAFRSGTWQLFVLVGAVFAHGIATLVSIILIRRGRPGLAVWLLIGALLVVVPIVPLAFVGLGLVLGVALVLVTAAIAGQMLPRKQTGWAVAASVVVGFGMLLLDQFGPDSRLSVPQLQVFFPAVSVMAVLVFGYFAARQFRDYALRTKMILTFVAVAAIAVVGVSFMTSRTMQSAFTEQIGKDYAVEAESLGRLVGSFFKAKVTQVMALTTVDIIEDQLEERNQGYTGSSAAILAEIQALDAQWVEAGDGAPLIRDIITPDLTVNPAAHQLAGFLKTFPSHTEVFVTDRYGATLAATGRLSDYYQADEGWWQSAWNDGEGAFYISDPEYDESAGVTALLIAVPVFDDETGQVMGIMRSTLNVESLFVQIGAARYGETGHAVLFDRSAEVLYEPVEEGEEGSAGLPLDLRQNLISMKHYMVATDADGDQFIFAHSSISASDSEEYETGAAIGEAVSNLGWTVVIRQEIEEAFAPITRITQNVQLLGAVILVLAGLGALFVAQIITRPLLALTTAAEAMGAGDLDVPLPPAGGDEVGSLTTSFGDMAAQLSNLIGSLEQRVAERTQALAYRSIQLETAAQVSEAASSILDPRELEQQAVELIRERFDYYYVGLFLVDQSGELTGEPNRWAVLRAGTGEAGQAMLEAGHKLEVGGESMIGRCVAEGQAHILLDVGEEAVRFNNPLLPDTHSEMALPLIAQGQVIGALSVQSEREAAFSDEDISILRTMATQVANAVANARLLEQTQAALEEANIFRQFAEASGQGVGMANLQGNIIYLNPTFCRLLGETSADDVIGKSLDSYYPAELRRRLQNEVLPTVLQKGQWVGELALLSSEGKITPTIENFFVIRDENAKPRYLANVMTDITERKLMEFEQERRGVRLQTVVEVSRVASSILDTGQLLTMSVNLIRDRFGFYHVGLFLMDDAGEYALLQAGTGEAGRAMLEDGYKLAVGGGTMIGWCVRNRQARIALDISEEAARFANPLLPDTRSEMALPLISRGQVIGAMTLQSAEEAAFSEADVSVLQSMADQLAVALEQARLYEDAERRAGAMEALYETSLQMTTAREMNQVLQSVVQQAVTLLGAGDGGMYLYDQDADELEWVVGYGPGAEKVGTRLKRGEGLSGKAMEERRPLVIDDYATWDERSSKFEDQPFTSVVAVPLLWQDELVGVLNVASRETFSEDDVRLLALLAQQAAATIANARLLQETQASLQEITRLHQRYLQEQWEEFLADEAARQQAGYLFDQRKVQPAGDLWRPEIEMAVARGRTLALTAEDAEWYDGDGGAKAALVVPLQLRDQIIGALDFFETDRDRQWSAEDVALVEAVADQVALAVENARAYEELQRTARELRELDKLKSQFLANMSHELRTPLNSIIGFSRVMLKGIDGPLTELQETDLTSIYNNGQHLLGLINDILDYSRIEAGKMELVFEPVDLRPIIEGVMSTAIGLVKDRPVKLVKEIADNLPTIRADSTRIRQVVLNLVSNAAKFTEEGSITIRAWIDGPQVAISVTDTGVGIPEESLEKVFQEFEQVDGSATRRVGGTGLGLPISRHFVEMHGGRIWVESREGVGSTFIFTIPIHGPGYVQDPELAALEIDPDRRLLVAVEDSDEMVGFYRHYLEKHGYQVVQLSDGSRASLWVRELSPFAVLLDVLLRETDGWEVLEELKMSRETAHVPVIVCSIVNEEARGLSLGAAAYLTKPVLEDDLLQALALAKELQSS